jgi:guanosine-3',5'-bis(diphosphate) 3'-pyrophosphohydrolase
MTRNRFVIEVGDTQALKAAISRLRSIDSVFDAYRVIPSSS